MATPHKITRSKLAKAILGRYATPDWRQAVLDKIDADLPAGVRRIRPSPYHSKPGKVSENAVCFLLSDGTERTFGTWANFAEADCADFIRSLGATGWYPPVPGERTTTCSDGTLTIRFNCEPPTVAVETTAGDNHFVTDFPLWS